MASVILITRPDKNNTKENYRPIFKFDRYVKNPK